MDIVLLKKGEEYYCIKCSYTGTAADIQEAYSHFRSRYRLIGTRLPLSD
ncbi:MAG: hypothetical protein GWP08_14855 [Nitrospiraceae bacterium]|nr:hypothetical protein [Nitrospiraceae bacterium]